MANGQTDRLTDRPAQLLDYAFSPTPTSLPSCLCSQLSFGCSHRCLQVSAAPCPLWARVQELPSPIREDDPG